uniref:LIM zinc finger domain containing 2 n=1 Tax=Oryctolagus cuniculus TaxID=9986 RepID=A0A5F9CQT5_RABIT
MTGSNMSDALANAVCQRCQARFAPAERIVNSNGELFHEHCFVCAQCFRPFPEGLFYEFEGRKYCEHDFQMLFAPCCGSCGEFIIGRVIKAMNSNWHPGCFRCELCDVELADLGFVKNAGRHLCRPCHNREKAKGLGKYICQRCHLVIDEQPLMFKNDAYHPDHFSCTHCGKELTAEARELKGELYCLPCHDKMGIPICGACRRPIEGRVVNALGKQWHVEHFVCAKCEKPFLGHRHYEKKGLAYCETHYNQLLEDLGDTGQLGLVLVKLGLVDEARQMDGILPRTLVEPTQVLGQLLGEGHARSQACRPMGTPLLGAEVMGGAGRGGGRSRGASLFHPRSQGGPQLMLPWRLCPVPPCGLALWDTGQRLGSLGPSPGSQVLLESLSPNAAPPLLLA